MGSLLGAKSLARPVQALARRQVKIAGAPQCALISCTLLCSETNSVVPHPGTMSEHVPEESSPNCLWYP